MIQRMLQREPGDSWAVPNANLIEPMEEAVKNCSQKCEAVANRLLILGSGKAAVQDFTSDLKSLQDRIIDLTEKLAEFKKLPSIDDLDRQALIALFSELACSFQEVKNQNKNKLDPAIRIYHDHLAEELTKTLGHPPAEGAQTAQDYKKEEKGLEPLFKCYRKQGGFSRTLESKPVSIKDSYIPLHLVDQEAYNKSLFDRSCHPKRLDLGMLFQAESASHVFIEGKAGSGKTLLCRYILYTWATSTQDERLKTLGAWTNSYEAILYLPFHEIRLISETVSIDDLVAILYPGFSVTNLDPKKILYILDGFEEVASIKNDKRGELIENLLDQPNWLVTSRPGFFSDAFWYSRRIQNLGFSDESAKAYISRFSEDFKVNGLDIERGGLTLLTHTPLYLELLCSLSKENPAIVQPEHQATLYHSIAIQMFRRFLDRQAPCNDEFAVPYRLCLEQIAFMSMERGSSALTSDIYWPILQSFSNENVEKFGMQLLSELGFLAPIGDSKELYRQELSFIDPKFETYFAAQHLLSALSTSTESYPPRLVNGQSAADWLNANCSNPNKRDVIEFAASLVFSDRRFNTLVEALLYPCELPLHQAVRLNLTRLAALLLLRGADVDAADDTGKLPLHLAAQNGQEEVVELLLSRGAKIDATDDRGMQPLHWAAIEGREKLIELLLIRGARIDAADENGMQSLHWAAFKGHKEAAERLLNSGAEVAAVGKQGQQPLHLAARNGHKEIIELLINRGAKIDATDENGVQPTHLAAMKGYIDIVTLFVQRGVALTALLHWAASKGNKEILELLLEMGAPIDATEETGRQSLHYAAEAGNKEIVELMLKRGAAIDVLDRSGKKPIDLAKENGYKEVVELLHNSSAPNRSKPETSSTESEELTKTLPSEIAEIERADKESLMSLTEAIRSGDVVEVERILNEGDTTDRLDEKGDQPIHKAVEYKQKEIVELLLNRGAKLDAADRSGYLPIHLAASKGYVEIVELLLNSGSKVDAALAPAKFDEFNSGMQPLHYAARSGHKEVIELLLKRGAKIDAVGASGAQPLHLAVMRNQKDTVKLLLKRGAKINAADDRGRRPLHYAANYGYKEIAKLLLNKGAKTNVEDKSGRLPIDQANEEIARLIRAKSKWFGWF